MNLTIEDIKNDIVRFNERIATAKAELDALPAGYLEFKKHKAREKIRRDLQADVKHCGQLVIYALEGIAIRERELC